jgi:pantothenate kinase-related protein Tda10
LTGINIRASMQAANTIYQRRNENRMISSNVSPGSVRLTRCVVRWRIQAETALNSRIKSMKSSAFIPLEKYQPCP